VAAAPQITVGSSLLTAGGTLAIKSARIAPNLPRCGALLMGGTRRQRPCLCTLVGFLRLICLAHRRLALPARQLAHRASTPAERRLTTWALLLMCRRCESKR
jgi:hypothetical protein